MEPVNRLSLLGVWASVSAAFWMVPIAGSQPTSSTPTPPAPGLSLSPPNHTFAPGERFQLICSPPERERAEKFQFYKLNPGGQWDLQIQREEDTWEVSTAHLEPESTFVCSYSARNSAGELLQSAQSNHVVSIVELPPPALSPEPKYPIYLPEERVTLTCSAPEGPEVSGYRFYKERRDQTLRELPNKGRGRYEAFRVDRSTAGKYSCAYWIQPSGRPILSPHSSPISIALTEHPRPPLFSVSPQQEVYQSGEFINLTCQTPASRRVSKVTFFKDEQRLPAIRLPTPQGDFRHTFPLLPQNGGRYSCNYQAVESERDIPSLMSNVVRVSVMVPQPSTSILAIHTYETTARATDSPGTPTLSALQLTSSQPAIEENSHSAEPDRPGTSLPRSSQAPSHDGVSSSTDSQSSPKPLDSQSSTKPLDSWDSTKQVDSQSSTKRVDPQRSTERLNSQKATKPSGSTKEVDSHSSTKPLDSQSTTKQLASWGSTKPIESRSSTLPLDSQGRTRSSRKTVTNIRDPRSTSQKRTVSVSENRNSTTADEETFNLPLVAGCSAAGALFLVVLVYLLRRTVKDEKKRTSRSFWNTLDDQQSRQISRIYSLRRTHLDLRETAKPQDVNQDWGVLPKSKAVSSRRGGPSTQSQADDDADSGAELEFPDIDLTYTLLGYPCSTFFLAESNPTAKDTHIYEETL